MVTQIVAWLGAVGMTLALLKQGVDLYRSRKREKDAIDEALERSPYVRDQLGLGNVGEAVKHLNAIIDSQARHIRGQDSRISHLEHREQALEAEAAGWESRYRGLEAEMAECTETTDRLLRWMRTQGIEPEE